MMGWLRKWWSFRRSKLIWRRWLPAYFNIQMKNLNWCQLDPMTVCIYRISQKMLIQLNLISVRILKERVPTTSKSASSASHGPFQDSATQHPSQQSWTYSMALNCFLIHTLTNKWKKLKLRNSWKCTNYK